MTTSLEQKIDELLELERTNARNLVVLYRRTTALALMMEAIAEKAEPHMPKTIRAEIDASLYPEEFQRLAEQDSAEFVGRYGENVLSTFQKHGIEGIMRIDDFAPPKLKQVN